MKDIEGYEGIYAVTEDGQVFSHRRGIYLAGGINPNGYRTVVLNHKGRKDFRKVHRLVAQTFIPNPDNLPVVNHLNSVRIDNNVSNLEWCTHQENAAHGSKNYVARVCLLSILFKYNLIT